MVGSDNLNRRSWTHDSELSCAVIDAEPDGRPPVDPGGEGDKARRFARDLRLTLMAEHIDAAAGETEDLLDPVGASDAVKASATRLQARPGTTAVKAAPPPRSATPAHPGAFTAPPPPVGHPRVPGDL